MTSIITREEVINEKLRNVEEGKLLLAIFDIAEELEMGKAIDMENDFSKEALEYIYRSIPEGKLKRIEDIAYKGLENVYYITELYLRGYYVKEKTISYEQFLNLILSKKIGEIITAANGVFILHMNRLKKIILKSKRKIPKGDKCYQGTLKLLEELDKDISICEKYPNTAIMLKEFYFAKYRSSYGPVMQTKFTGILAFEEYIYSLYNELCILSKLDINDIHMVVNNCADPAKGGFNLFEKVINSYIFSIPYSEKPYLISRVDAELLIKEIKMGTLSAEELINQLIDKLKLEGYRREYLERYQRYIQECLDLVRETGYFAELFLISPD